MAEDRVVLAVDIEDDKFQAFQKSFTELSVTMKALIDQWQGVSTEIGKPSRKPRRRHQRWRKW
jgi:hypothetical protein